MVVAVAQNVTCVDLGRCTDTRTGHDPELARASTVRISGFTSLDGSPS